MWTKLDDRTSENGKVDGLSDAAYRLWTMLLVWSRQTNNLWLGGRIPAGSVATIARNKWKGRRLHALVQELVKAVQGGRSGLGLLEVTEDGWQIHDWSQYGPDRADFALTQNDLAAKGGKASAEARKAREGTAIPKNARNRPKKAESVTEPVRTETEPVRTDNTEPVRSKAPEPVREKITEPTEPPDPDPDLKSPKPSFGFVRLERAKPTDARDERIQATASAIDEALARLEAERVSEMRKVAT